MAGWLAVFVARESFLLFSCRLATQPSWLSSMAVSGSGEPASRDMAGSGSGDVSLGSLAYTDHIVDSSNYVSHTGIASNSSSSSSSSETDAEKRLREIRRRQHEEEVSVQIRK